MAILLNSPVLFLLKQMIKHLLTSGQVRSVICSKIKQSISKMVLSSSGEVMLVPSQAIGHLEVQLLDALQFPIAKGTLRVHC